MKKIKMPELVQGIEVYVENKDDWMLQLHHMPWNKEEANA